MDYKAIIDFNKYTLALAAGGFAYVLKSYGKPEQVWIYWFVMVILILFLFSVICGILVASTATSRLNRIKEEQSNHDKLIRMFGITHIISMIVGMLFLGTMVFTDLKFPTKESRPNKSICCCCEK